MHQSVSVVNFQSCYCMGFCITTHFSVLTIKLQKVLLGYFLFEGKKKEDKNTQCQELHFKQQTIWLKTVFFKGECCWSPVVFFSVTAFQHVSSSTFVSFKLSPFPVLFKQSSHIPFENLCLFPFILSFCLVDWTLPSQYSYNCNPHRNTYYKWYT